MLKKRPANWAQPVVEGSNLFRVTDTLYRSEQPLTADQTWLSARNIQTVISLRSSGKRDQKELGALGAHEVRHRGRRRPRQGHVDDDDAP